MAPKREARNSTSPAKHSGGLDAAEAPFAFLTHTPAAQQLGLQPLPNPASTSATAATESRTPLTTHTTFTTSQLPHLRHLLASLKPHLGTTALPSSTAASKNAEEVARERKVYLESQSKRILERRGVDTRDGVEGIWEARRVGGEEVRGLEGLVGGLARGKETDRSRGDGEGEEMDTS